MINATRRFSRPLVIVTSVLAAIAAAAPAGATTSIEHIGPNSQRVFTCDRNYRPLSGQRPGALRLEGTALRPLSVEIRPLRHSTVRVYDFGSGVSVVEGRIYRVVTNEGAGRLRYRDRC